MQKKNILTLLFLSFLFSMEADHIIFNKIVISPSEAELISIYNPTEEPIDLSDYYLSDAEDSFDNQHYYNLPTGNSFWNSDSNKDFIVRFPINTMIDSYETIIIALDEQSAFNSYYADYYSGFRIFYLQSDMLNAIHGEDTIGSQSENSYSGYLSDSYEPLILFKWDGDPNSLIEDVDYFYWGLSSSLSSFGINKTGVLTYRDDTSFDIQGDNILEAHGSGEAYVRISNVEDGEKNPDNSGFIGNGITEHDETSEVFINSWEIVSQSGCTIEEDPNYNSNAIVDDGSCLIGEITHTIQEIVSIPTEGLTEDDEYEATIMGLIVDYDDIRPSNGPEVIVLQEGVSRIDLVVWDWDVLSSDIGYMLAPGNLSEYVIIAKGTVGVWNGSYQFTVDSSDNITFYHEYHAGGEYIQEHIVRPSIDPAPFVIIPTLGERLDYSFSFPSNSKVVVKIFDFNGNLVTSLLEKFYENSGTIKRMEDNSEWDGKNHLGQTVPPGTYLMHIETTNIFSGESSYDVAPIVVGVY